jgi:hypothetical protein
MSGRKQIVFVLGLFFVLAVLVNGAQARFLSRRQAESTPRGRIACVPSSTMGVRYPDPFALGNHSYASTASERNGIVYTCRAGHIDITHLRKIADWTAYLASKLQDALLEDRTEFSYRMWEPSVYHVRIAYPPAWPSLVGVHKESVAHEVAIELAQYLAFNCGTWHEILTWFGYRGIGIWPEYQSAFSWEDNYSNLLGCRLAAKALRDPDHDFDTAMTTLLQAELRDLGVQPSSTAYRAAEAVRGWWFNGFLWTCEIVKRHFDVGLDDGYVTPWLVPGMAECDGVEPQDYPVPTLSDVQAQGFAVRFEIEPREWERTKILRIVQGDNERSGRIEPARHFAPIIEYIRGQAVARYGSQVDDRLGRPQSARRQHDSRKVDFEDIATLAARWLNEDNS